MGTTTIIADPHEIANVCGLAGLKYMAEAAEQTVLDIQFMAPSCVPATSFDHSGAVIGAEELARALQDSYILGAGEFMNYPGVAAAQDDVLDKLTAAHEAGKIVDGHSPGLHGGGLQAYAAAGIRTDHECSTVEEALERISLGMYVLLRNGSACRDLPNLIGAVTPQNLRRFLLCSDDLHLKTIFSKGHLNEHLRLCVRHGISPEGAVTMATLNAAECYGLSDRGALAPGKRANGPTSSCLMICRSFPFGRPLLPARKLRPKGRIFRLLRRLTPVLSVTLCIWPVFLPTSCAWPCARRRSIR